MLNEYVNTRKQEVEDLKEEFDKSNISKEQKMNKVNLNRT